MPSTQKCNPPLVPVRADSVQPPPHRCVSWCGRSGNSDPAYASFSACSRSLEPTCSCINLGQPEQPVGHGRRPNGSPGESRHHGCEIISPVEAVFELSEISRHVLLVDRSIRPNDGGFDISQCRID